MPTCSIQEIHPDIPGSLCGFRTSDGRKKLVADPRDLSLGIFVIGSLQILDSDLILRLGR